MRSVIRVVKKYGILLDNQQKRHVAILVVLMIIGAIMESMSVSMILPIITTIMSPETVSSNALVIWVYNFFGLQSDREFILLMVIALIIMFIVKNLFLIFEFYAQYRFSYNNRYRTQARLMHSYLYRPYEYYLNATSGNIMRSIQSDTDTAFALLSTMLNVFTELVVAIVLVVTIFWIAPFLTLLVAVTLLVLVFVITKVVKPILLKEGKNRNIYSAEAYKWLLQSIDGIKEIKVSNTENFFENNYKKVSQHAITAQRKYHVIDVIPRTSIEMGSMIAMLGAIGVMVYSGQDMNAILPSLSALAMAAVKLLPSANRISSGLNSIAFQENALDNVLDSIEEAEQTMPKRSDSDVSVPFKKGITLKGLSFRYPNTEKDVLHKINLNIDAGKSIGIVGPSGAGKTTLIDVLLGLLEPYEGEILSDGININKNLSSWHSNIGYIPQVIFMMDDTIRANVAFGQGNGKIEDDRVWHALEEAQLADFVRQLPEGIDTKIGEKGIRISGGQRQRIGIARALYLEPELLVFDEATSSLDNETEAAIMESINGLHGKKTLLIIAHRLQTIEGCDEVYRVENGDVVRER